MSGQHGTVLSFGPFELSIGNRSRLANQLIEALLGDGAVTLIVSWLREHTFLPLDHTWRRPGRRPVSNHYAALLA